MGGIYTEEDRDARKVLQKALVEAAKKTGIEGFTCDFPIYNAIDF